MLRFGVGLFCFSCLFESSCAVSVLTVKMLSGEKIKNNTENQKSCEGRGAFSGEVFSSEDKTKYMAVAPIGTDLQPF